jgi:hypothetical protein
MRGSGAVSLVWSTVYYPFARSLEVPVDECPV